MDNCLFCQIITGQIPSIRLLDNDQVTAFLDIAPAAKGHALVVPKIHVETIVELPHEFALACVEAIQQIGGAHMKALKADGFNVFQNNGKAAGQSVLHCHFHVVPRWKNDGLELWIGRPMDKKELEDHAVKLRRHLK